MPSQNVGPLVYRERRFDRWSEPLAEEARQKKSRPGNAVRGVCSRIQCDRPRNAHQRAFIVVVPGRGAKRQTQSPVDGTVNTQSCAAVSNDGVVARPNRLVGP